MLFTIGAYSSLLSPAVVLMRQHWNYDPQSNSLQQRIDILYDVASGEMSSEAAVGADDPLFPLFRFVHAPIQSYLINEWREGRPGVSLSDAWAAAIPRVLWPEKPNVTRYATELYSQTFDTGDAPSAQASTYTAEAYWNYGWPGLVVVSILLGLELGWFTRKWLNVIYGGSSQLGIVLFCVPVIISALYVETFIAANYIGGFLTLVVLIKAADHFVPLFTRRPSSDSVAQGS